MVESGRDVVEAFVCLWEIPGAGDNFGGKWRGDKVCPLKGGEVQMEMLYVVGEVKELR